MLRAHQAVTASFDAACGPHDLESAFVNQFTKPMSRGPFVRDIGGHGSLPSLGLRATTGHGLPLITRGNGEAL